MRDAGFKVVLTGEGSDELLAGYAHFRQDMLLYDSAGQDPSELERLVKSARAGEQGLTRHLNFGRESGRLGDDAPATWLRAKHVHAFLF